jgi:hypothetical protein
MSARSRKHGPPKAVLDSAPLELSLAPWASTVQGAKAAERARLKAATLAALGDNDAAVENQNRLRLRRPSAQFEFAMVILRVFYCTKHDQVLVDAIGCKRGNRGERQENAILGPLL